MVFHKMVTNSLCTLEGTCVYEFEKKKIPLKCITLGHGDHACNLSYLGGGDQENYGLSLARAKS
jgi:hypothetical protein